MLINKNIRDMKHFFEDMANISKYMIYGKRRRGVSFLYKAEKFFSNILYFSLIVFLLPSKLHKKESLKKWDFALSVLYVSSIVFIYVFANIPLTFLGLGMLALSISSLLLAVSMEVLVSIINFQGNKWLLKNNRLEKYNVVKSQVMKSFLSETNLTWSTFDFAYMNFDKFIDWKNNRGDNFKKENLLFAKVEKLEHSMIFTSSKFFQKVRDDSYLLMLDIKGSEYKSVVKNIVDDHSNKYNRYERSLLWMISVNKKYRSDLDRDILEALQGMERENVLKNKISLLKKDEVLKNKRNKI